MLFFSFLLCFSQKVFFSNKLQVTTTIQSYPIDVIHSTHMHCQCLRMCLFNVYIFACGQWNNVDWMLDSMLNHNLFNDHYDLTVAICNTATDKKPSSMVALAKLVISAAISVATTDPRDGKVQSKLPLTVRNIHGCLKFFYKFCRYAL